MRIPSRMLATAATVLWLSAMLPGCAATSPDRPSMTDAAGMATAPGPGLRKTSDLVFEYRQQAAELRQMARRLELEANLYAQRQDELQATRTRELAKDALASADAADQRARDYQRQLPHGQVY
ncbi:hypothetical protein [Nitrospira sp. Nam74]